MNVSQAIRAVNGVGMMLVFPIQNKREPHSLWYHFYPRSKMKWEWSEDGADERVSQLWHLREKLSSSQKVVYCKWYRDRATVISLELFPALLRLALPGIENHQGLKNFLRPEANEVLTILDDNSPLSTKQLKELSGLQGKLNESDYSRRLKELWRKFLIVGVGEVDDGAFPSLAIASTRLYFEEEWNKALTLSDGEALRLCRAKLGERNEFFRYLIKHRSN